MRRQERPVRPKCQCKQRAEAIKRAAAAVLRGDTEAASVENDFIRRSLVEDVQAMKEYSKQVALYYTGPSLTP